MMMNRVFNVMALLLALTVSKAWSQQVSHLKVGTWNVGHFNSGKLGGYQGTDAIAGVAQWQRFIETNKPDIFCVQEWNTYFDKDSSIVACDRLATPFYQSIWLYQPLYSRWILNGIFTNYPVDESSRYTIGLAQDVYYVMSQTITIDGHKLDVLCGHIPWNSKYHAEALRLLKEELRRHKIFIFMADTNSLQEEQLLFRTEEGYHTANPIDSTWILTTADGKYYDNIIASSNITFDRVSSSASGLYEGDHFPVFCDITIQWDDSTCRNSH